MVRIALSEAHASLSMTIITQFPPELLAIFCNVYLQRLQRKPDPAVTRHLSPAAAHSHQFSPDCVALTRVAPVLVA